MRSRRARTICPERYNRGRIGIGYASLRTAGSNVPADVGTLSLTEVDSLLTELAAIRGAGSTAARTTALTSLFARATRDEQHFLLRLLTGELRQGALAGVMVDAIASAAGLPVNLVRRAAMYSKSLGAVARVALLEGATGLAGFHLELFSPVSPMLAQTAADVEEALSALQARLLSNGRWTVHASKCTRLIRRSVSIRGT